MYLNKKRILSFLPLFAGFLIYLLLLFRSYSDVVYMDQVQILAGNINNIYNNDTTLHDYYYRTPFLLTGSILLVFLNCKILLYNTYFENIISSIILMSIAYFFFKKHEQNFSQKSKLIFSCLVSLTVFCFNKWEMSLWGGGFSHYFVVLIGLLYSYKAHHYYFSKTIEKEENSFFFASYILLSVIAILEATSYYIPFLISIFIISLINRRILGGKIDFIRWKKILLYTGSLILFSLIINYCAEEYSSKYTYAAYEKVNVSQNLSQSFSRFLDEPGFVLKFFFSSFAGTLIDKDSYTSDSSMYQLFPILGFLIFVSYLAAIYIFYKRKDIQSIFSIGLIVTSLIFLGTVLIGRLGFNDVYYGASSRYTAISFTGILGLSTFILLNLEKNTVRPYLKKIIWVLPLVIICLFSIIINKNQWEMAPHRKKYYKKIEENLKANKNLEILMGYTNEITAAAREVLIRNKLNVFKPMKRLTQFTSNTASNQSWEDLGFYKTEKDDFGPFRWTDGSGIIVLPNLYTTADTVSTILQCYSPQGDTPIVVLNDKFYPFKVEQTADGYKYYYLFQEQKVLYNALIISKPLEDSLNNNPSIDKRKLGIIFRELRVSQN